jgi:hypothetical protein
LGYFELFGQLFTLGGFLKIAEEVQNFELLHPCKSYVLILEKKMFWDTSWDFFTNSSDRPVSVTLFFSSGDGDIIEYVCWYRFLHLLFP